jgi:hypothetical protein
MRYIQPKIVRTDEAVSSIQHFSGYPDDQKPIVNELDAAGTVFTDAAAYEADE